MMHQELGAKDVVAIVRRRFLLISVLSVIGIIAGIVAARVLPKRYISRTLVLVQQPEAQPVTPLVTDNVNQRLATMQQQILSTTRLEPVIRDLNLYPRDINRMPMDMLVERLRQAITITPIAPMTETRAQNLPGFTISVVFDDPQLAQKICSMITSMFIEEDIKVSRGVDFGTTQFLNRAARSGQSETGRAGSKARRVSARTCRSASRRHANEHESFERAGFSAGSRDAGGQPGATG